MLMRAFSVAASESTPRPVQRIELPLLDRKLDGPASYLSWSRLVRYTLEGKDLEGYLTGDKNEPVEGSPERSEWKSTHMTIYIWLLSSLTPSIASTVDDIDRVKDVWEKLKRTYDGVGNNLRVFQIEREIEAVVQGDRSIVGRLWSFLVSRMLQRSWVQERGARYIEEDYALHEGVEPGIWTEMCSVASSAEDFLPWGDDLGYGTGGEQD
jgi:hypothetical protein